MQLNRGNLSAFTTGLQTTFNQAFLQAPTDYEQYTMTVPSSTSQEQYAWMGLIPGLREWVGDRQLANIKSYDYTIKNKDWERTLEVLRTDIEDDTYGIYSPMAAMLGMEAKRHPQELISSLLINGFTSKCYDGQNFFDTNHPTYNQDGTVTLVSNNMGGASNPWYLVEDKRGVMPFIFQKRKDPQFVTMDKLDDESVFMRKQFRYGVDYRGNVGYGLWQLCFASKQTLDATGYQAARAAMMSQTGDEGRKLGTIPGLLICGPSNEAAAKTLLNADFLANGSTNVYKGTAKLIVSPYLP
jgi:phage major head subunit gpT-like protein